MHDAKNNAKNKRLLATERGEPNGVANNAAGNPALPDPEVSVGDWSWTKEQDYISLKSFIDQLLIDIVCKNGNLLMNIPLRADGSLDDESVALPKGMGRWLRVIGEGIYGTRPFVVFGEGPTAVSGGHFAEIPELTGKDFRFATKGDTVYTFICGEPRKRVRINQLSKLRYHAIKSVRMLDVTNVLQFEQLNSDLIVYMPESLPSRYAVCLKIAPDMVRGSFNEHRLQPSTSVVTQFDEMLP